MTDEDIIVEDEGMTGFDDTTIEEIEGQIDSKLKKAKAEIESLRKEKQEYLDGWQRSKADYVNALKRFEEERMGANIAGKLSVIEEILPIYSTLERAKEAGELPEGFSAIAKQLETAFASLSITEIGVVGEKFDFNLHQALGTDPTEDAGKDDTVSAVFEKGYKMGERIIRPAMVRVFSIGH